jgi:hypothetical protein
MLCGLRCPTAGDKNRIVFPIRSARPKKMMVRTTSLLVLPESTILFKVIDRPRIRITVVEVLDLLCHTRPPLTAGFSTGARFR